MNISKKAFYRKEIHQDLIKDLILNSNVLIMKQYIQHGDITCFEHCMSVSYASFLICRFFNLDYKAAARGAMLHDLFLYDWRITRPQEGLHAFHHPQIALDNANRNFILNKKEQDIIQKHMWPVTMTLPKYKESYIVSVMDKYCAILEILKHGLVKTQANKLI